MMIVVRRNRLFGAFTSGSISCADVSALTMESPLRSGLLLPVECYLLELDDSDDYGDQGYAESICVDNYCGGILIKGRDRKRITVGTSAAEANGSILVGLSDDRGVLHESMDAYAMLYPMIVAAIKSGEEVMLDITEGN